MKGVSIPQTVAGFARTGGLADQRLGKPPNRTRLSIVLAALPLLFALTAFGQQPTRDDAEQHYRRAQQALERKDYETAAEAWKAITALMPDLPEARANLGMIYHLQRKYEQAIREFREALRRNPRLQAAKVFLGIDYYLTSRPESAIDELADAVEMDPRNAEARKWLALSHLQAGNLGEAITEFKECQRLDSSDHELIFHLGRTYRKLSTQAFFVVRQDRFDSAWFYLFRGEQFTQQGDTGKALEELRPAARMEPRLPGVHYRIGKLLEARNQPLKAVESYIREVRNFPSHLPAATGLVRLLTQMGMEAEANRIRRLAETLHKDRPAALQALAAAAVDSPTARQDPLPEQDAQRIREALPDLQAGADSSWTDKAHAALLAGGPREALGLVRRAAADGNADQTEYQEARAYLDLGRLEEALQGFLALHNRHPTDAEFAFYVQKCAERLSAQSLESFASLEPNSYRTHQLRAEHHAAREEDDEAVEAYRQALAVNPEAAQLHLEIGTLHMKRRRYEEAIVAFQAELKNDPFSVPALARTGEAYFLTGKTNEAQKVSLRAIEINPKSAAAHKVLGQVGWEVSGIMTLSSGFPLGDIRVSPSRTGAFGGSARPDLVGDACLSSGRSRSERISRWVDENAFRHPEAFTFGSAPRNLNCRGDGWKNFDISITKHIPIKESVRAEFRAEFFNAFNRTQFRHPSTGFGGGSFGQVTSQENEPRIIQLALKIHF